MLRYLILFITLLSCIQRNTASNPSKSDASMRQDVILWLWFESEFWLNAFSQSQCSIQNCICAFSSAWWWVTTDWTRLKASAESRACRSGPSVWVWSQTAWSQTDLSPASSDLLGFLFAENEVGACFGSELWLLFWRRLLHRPERESNPEH